MLSASPHQNHGIFSWSPIDSTSQRVLPVRAQAFNRESASSASACSLASH